MTALWVIFNPKIQKKISKDKKEARSKTLEYLRSSLRSYLADPNKEILWLDIGCGNGRSLEVIKDLRSEEKNCVIIHGIDESEKYLSICERKAKRFKIKKARFCKIKVSELNVNSRYDIVSAVLLLHEVDPLELPISLKNMLKALKENGRLIIVDFDGPFERENDTVAWKREEIEHILDQAGMGKCTETIDSDDTSNQLRFFSMYVHKGKFNDSKYDEFMAEYERFLETKRDRCIENLKELDSKVMERFGDILGLDKTELRSNFNPREINEDLSNKLKEIDIDIKISMNIMIILNKNIVFLDTKIKELRDRRNNKT